jgi:putative hydrolase
MTHYFKRFNALSSEDLCVDLHMHSTYTDGEGSLEEIVEIAKQRGLKRIALTDHARKESTYVGTYFKHIDRLADESDIELLKGVEVKVNNFSGDADVSDAVREMADILIVSVHRFPLGRSLYAANKFDKCIAQKIELDLALAAVEARSCDVLGHPGGMSMRAFQEFPLDYYRELIEACSRNDIVFEISSAYHKPVAGQLIPLLGEYNPFVSFSSDAHTLDRIGERCEEFTRYFDGEG